MFPSFPASDATDSLVFFTTCGYVSLLGMLCSTFVFNILPPEAGKGSRVCMCISSSLHGPHTFTEKCTAALQTV